MNARNWLWIPGLLLAGSMSMDVAIGSMEPASSALVSPAYAGRRADHVPTILQSSPSERAEFAAMDTASAAPMVNEPAYSGRRADHILALLNSRNGGERAEFAAFDNQAASQAGSTRSEPAYGGRRADHLELLR
jgi:hypothetical protein